VEERTEERLSASSLPVALLRLLDTCLELRLGEEEVSWRERGGSEEEEEVDDNEDKDKGAED